MPVLCKGGGAPFCPVKLNEVELEAVFTLPIQNVIVGGSGAF